MTDITDELRIIAKDGGRLSSSDRALIARAADEMEQALHRAVETETALLEANAARLALSDRVRELTRDNDPLPWSMSTGWINAEVRG